MKKQKINASRVLNEVTTKMLITESKIGKWKQNKVFKTKKAKVLAELIGTFILTFLIISPSTFGFSSNPNLPSWFRTIFQIPLLSTLWPALVIGLAIILFYKISCNLNPAVTVFEWKIGIYTKEFALILILTQFIGAILASYSAWGIAHAVNPTLLTSPGNFEMDAVAPVFQSKWPMGGNVYAGGSVTMEGVYQAKDIGLYFFVMLSEFVGVCLLLYAIIKLSYKPSFAIKMILASWLIVRLMVPFGTFDLNPARSFAPALTTFTQGGAKGPLMFTWVYIIPQFAAAIFMSRTFKEPEDTRVIKLKEIKENFKL